MALEYTEIFRTGDINTLRELLDNGLDPNYTRFELLYGIETSLLKLAIFYKQFEMTKLLISRGADVNKISDHCPFVNLDSQKAVPVVKQLGLNDKPVAVNLTQEIEIKLDELKTQISLINEKIQNIENRLEKLESINFTAQIEENNLMNSEQLFKINQRLNYVSELEKTIQDTQSKFEDIVLNLKNEIDELKNKQV